MRIHNNCFSHAEAGGRRKQDGGGWKGKKAGNQRPARKVIEARIGKKRKSKNVVKEKWEEEEGRRGKERGQRRTTERDRWLRRRTKRLKGRRQVARESKGEEEGEGKERQVAKEDKEEHEEEQKEQVQQRRPARRGKA